MPKPGFTEFGFVILTLLVSCEISLTSPACDRSGPGHGRSHRHPRYANPNPQPLAILPPSASPVSGGDRQNGSCPEGFRIFPKDGKCYKYFGSSMSMSTNDVSPCPPFMTFYKNTSNPTTGFCDCKEQEMGITRPIVYWGKKDRCYWLFDQGPCAKRDWLVLDDCDVPICSPRSCPENSPKDWSPDPLENKRKYWFSHMGNCSKSGEMGYCDNKNATIFLVFEKPEYTTTCKIGEDIVKVKNLLGDSKPLPCLPGHRQSLTGECSPSRGID